MAATKSLGFSSIGSLPRGSCWAPADVELGCGVAAADVGLGGGVGAAADGAEADDALGELDGSMAPVGVLPARVEAACV